jgi:hypothetical protein
MTKTDGFVFAVAKRFAKRQPAVPPVKAEFSILRLTPQYAESNVQVTSNNDEIKFLYHLVHSNNGHECSHTSVYTAISR